MEEHVWYLSDINLIVILNDNEHFEYLMVKYIFKDTFKSNMENMLSLGVL